MWGVHNETAGVGVASWTIEVLDPAAADTLADPITGYANNVAAGDNFAAVLGPAGGGSGKPAITFGLPRIRFTLVSGSSTLGPNVWVWMLWRL